LADRRKGHDVGRPHLAVGPRPPAAPARATPAPPITGRRVARRRRPGNLGHVEVVSALYSTGEPAGRMLLDRWTGTEFLGKVILPSLERLATFGKPMAPALHPHGQLVDARDLWNSRTAVPRGGRGSAPVGWRTNICPMLAGYTRIATADQAAGREMHLRPTPTTSHAGTPIVVTSQSGVAAPSSACASSMATSGPLVRTAAAGSGPAAGRARSTKAATTG
jgi:hypothetical protein